MTVQRRTVLAASALALPALGQAQRRGHDAGHLSQHLLAALPARPRDNSGREKEIAEARDDVNVHQQNPPGQAKLTFITLHAPLDGTPRCPLNMSIAQ